LDKFNHGVLIPSLLILLDYTIANYLGWLSISGLILGIVALVQIEKRAEKGKGFAITGIVLCALTLPIWFCTFGPQIGEALLNILNILENW
jgi:hypothetical protein